MVTSRTVLVVDDDDAVSGMLKRVFRESAVRFLTAREGREGIRIALNDSPDTMVLDLGRPDMDGLGVIQTLRQRNCQVPVVLVTASGSPQIEKNAMEVGAAAYLEKPLKPELLECCVRRAMAADQAQGRPGIILGRSPALEVALRLASRLAATDLPVLIEGESGTGKELVASMIHGLGPRRDAPWVVFDPSTVPESLLESALFGHERGAFTGAVERGIGHFEAANGGTLMMDEIGNLPCPLQAKLLRVLQDHVLTPLGSSRRVSLDVRVLACTNASLADLVERGDFRLDLYHRLKGARIYLPPLRERRDDIVDLVEFFLAEANRKHHKKVSSIARQAMDCLLAYPWPGNVRELRNAIHFAHAMASECIQPEDLSEDIRNAVRAETHACPVDMVALDHLIHEAIDAGGLDLKGFVTDLTTHVEKHVLHRVLSGRTQESVARLLGLDPGTISRKLRALGIASPPRFKVQG